MINLTELHTNLVDQDTALRSAMNWWTESDRLRTMPALSTAEILAEGLCAIHERLGNIAEILAMKS